MPFFLLGIVALLAFMWVLGAFSKAQVATIKQFGFWVAAIGGLLLAVLLPLTKGPAGLGVLVFIVPLLWSWVGESRLKGKPRRPAGRAPSPSAAMSRAEAYQVLGIAPGATEAEIRAAHHRLMRAAHPDSGGSDWIAARINQARDLLLG